MSRNTERDAWIGNVIKNAIKSGKIKRTRSRVVYMRGKPVTIFDGDLKVLLEWAWAGGQHQRNQHFQRAISDWKDQK